MAALADRWMPKLVLSPSIVISLVFVYGFILITGYLSLSTSRLMPRYDFAGFDRYVELFDNDVWWTSAANLGWFGIPFIAICVGLGLFLAILLDQKIRNEGALRAVFLYPMALSFIVTGTAWQWIMTPSVGLEKVFHDWGWTSFSFTWLGDPDKAIFCVVIEHRHVARNCALYVLQLVFINACSAQRQIYRRRIIVTRRGQTFIVDLRGPRPILGH